MQLTVVHPKQKFEPRTIPYVFIGYPCSHKGYKLYDMQSKKNFISRDVKFCEDDFPFSSASQTLTLALQLQFYHFMIHPTQTSILILLFLRRLLCLLFLLQIHQFCECLLNPPHLNGVKVILFIIK